MMSDYELATGFMREHTINLLEIIPINNQLQISHVKTLSMIFNFLNSLVKTNDFTILLFFKSWQITRIVRFRVDSMNLF